MEQSAHDDSNLMVMDSVTASDTVASLIETDEPDTSDKSKRVVLPANCLVILNGQKCQLRINPESGVLVAYPVKEDDDIEEDEDTMVLSANDGTPSLTLHDNEHMSGVSGQHGMVSNSRPEDSEVEIVNTDSVPHRRDHSHGDIVDITQVIAGKDVDDEAIIDMSHVIVCGSDGGITSAAHDGETVIDTGVDTEETVLRLSGENEIHVHTISTSDVSTQHDQVEFITVSSSEDASHIPETEQSQIVYMEGDTIDDGGGMEVHTLTAPGIDDNKGNGKKGNKIDKTAAQGLLELSSTADEYDPDEPLRIVARRQQTIRTRVTALPKFIIPSVGGNITSKAITQQQVAAITTLNPAGIGSIPCGEQSDVIDEEAAADEEELVETVVLDPKLTETNVQTIKPLLKQYLIRSPGDGEGVHAVASCSGTAHSMITSEDQREFTSSDDLTSSLGIKTSGEDLERLKCQTCNYQAYYPQQYEKHLRTSHAADLHKCQCCSFVCLVKSDLIKHYLDIHPRNICEICHHTSAQPYVIKRHMYRHTSEGCTCDVCGKTYKDQYILKMHIKMVHTAAEVLYECEICSKKFNRKAHLKRHMRTHSAIKAFACPKCDYRGSERADVTKHMLIHEAPKLSCELCAKTFRHQKNKDLHMKRHAGQRDFKCGVCDFFGYTFTDIRKHIERRHTEMKTLICDKCGQSFKSEFAYQEHMYTWHHVDGTLNTVSEAGIGEDRRVGDHIVGGERTVVVDTAGIVSQSELSQVGSIVTAADGTILTEVQVDAITHHHSSLSGNGVAVEFTSSPSGIPTEAEEFIAATSSSDL